MTAREHAKTVARADSTAIGRKVDRAAHRLNPWIDTQIDTGADDAPGLRSYGHRIDTKQKEGHTMTRKYPIAIAAAAVAGGAVLVPASLGQDGASPDTLSLQMRHREAKVTFVDERPRMSKRRPSESPGDTAIARGALRAASGARVGRAHSEFVVTGGRSPRTTEQATGTLELPDGQIAIHGVFNNTGSDKDVIAIVGGTERYNGARGSVEITSGRRAVTFALRFVR